MAFADVPRPALLLGSAGLIPFIASTSGAWLLPEPFNYLAAQAGLVYAPVIITFLGAVHWGVAMAGDAQSMSYPRLGLSILPAVVAWVALLSHPIPALILMTASFAILYLADVGSIRVGRFPSWYRDLRRPLTLVVLVCLIGLLVFSIRGNV